jgi:hypothetical protein
MIKVHELMDKYVYSTEDYSKNGVTKTTLAMPEIEKVFFPSENSVVDMDLIRNSINAYCKTLIEMETDNSHEFLPLVKEAALNNEELHIEHFNSALEIYTYHPDRSVKITNSSIENVFWFSMGYTGIVLLEYISRGYSGIVDIEELKSKIGFSSTNAEFVYRIIKPSVLKIKSLYDAGLIPFYVEIETTRSTQGKGRKITGLQYTIKDYVSALRQTHKVDGYMSYLDETLSVFYPFDNIALMDKIKASPIGMIEEIYIMVSTIGKDPDAYIKPVEEVIKNKLQLQFGIMFPKYHPDSLL